MEGFLMFFAPLFLLGSVWSIVFIGFVFAMLITVTENEYNFLAVAILTIFGTAFFWFNKDISLPPLSTLIMYALYYVGIGAMWSIGKWYFFTKKCAVEFGKTKVRFFEYLNNAKESVVCPDHEMSVKFDIRHLLPIVADPKTKIENENVQYLFRQWVQNETTYSVYSNIRSVSEWSDYIDQFVPKASENKDKLVRWIAWWPFSATWTLINDPIRKIANQVFAQLHGVYTKISKRAFAGMIE
jgi:hypothetical protein